MQYRSDIDGLRAIAVIAVIIYHADLGVFSGGFVGVDIFFVISGYLITGLIFNDVRSGTFSYFEFYKRRIARLLPSLIITLFFVLISGFFFYSNNAFDNLGKEIFFSSIGAANILFGQGTNYFAKDVAVKPLIHLWSLGVEEQFYLVWPTLLLLLARLKNRRILFVIALLFLISFYMATAGVKSAPAATYFFPQYRAFELLVGAFAAILMQTAFFKKLQLKQNYMEAISYISVGFILIPMFLLSKESVFPGPNALYPVIGTGIFLVFSLQTRVSKLFSSTPLVIIGLISYPLYLYHQPIISYLHFFDFAHNKIVLLFITFLTSLPLSWLTFKYIENPVRNYAHNKNKSSIGYLAPLIICLFFLAVCGLYVAKNDGIALRFKFLNPFSYQVSKMNESTFHNHFERGVNLSEKNNGKALFTGDSVLQQYVYPLSKALNLEAKDIDTITRGGCVLLKGVEFRDKFADIPARDLRESLYKIDTSYKYVVISQDWDSYDDSILNINKSDSHNALEKWTPFINKTVEHFKTRAEKIIVIGRHLNVAGTSAINPTIFLTAEDYKNGLDTLKVANIDDLIESRSFFNKWSKDVIVIHPIELWSHKKKFKLHNNKWSFFYDHQHLSRASTAYLVKRLKEVLSKNQAKMKRGQR